MIETPPFHTYWQEFDAPGAAPASHGALAVGYSAPLPDGRRLTLPIRVLPGDGTRAVASLIVNQASFAVVDGLAEALTAAVEELRPEVVVAVPTLGLTLGEAVARRLGNTRLVALSTSRKFWYRDELSVPLSSITSPAPGKRLYLDPHTLPVLADRRILVVDDVVSTGTSLSSAMQLLRTAGLEPCGLAVAMAQSERWRTVADEESWPPMRWVIASPLLEKDDVDAPTWRPIA